MKNTDSYFLFVNKPVGITSQKCLSRLKRENNFKKIGHHGTLDPFADGLLLVGVNQATKFFPYIDDTQKTYTATILLGSRTDTLDKEGTVLEEKDIPDLSLEAIRAHAKSMVGEKKQKPPMYSAVKINGKKLYEYARQGAEVERKERSVSIFDFEIIEWNSPYLKIATTVSRGTYVRVLASDFAENLGTCGHLTELTRTELCKFSLERAYSFGDNLSEKKISISEMFPAFVTVELDGGRVKNLFYGKPIPLEEQERAVNSIVAAFQKNRFLGLLAVKDGHFVAERLMNPNDFL